MAVIVSLREYDLNYLIIKGGSVLYMGTLFFFSLVSMKLLAQNVKL